MLINTCLGIDLFLGNLWTFEQDLKYKLWLLNQFSRIIKCKIQKQKICMSIEGIRIMISLIQVWQKVCV